MTAVPHPASLTVYTDQATGIRIALAVHRPGGSLTRIAWKRLAYGGLEEAVAKAVRASAARDAFAVVLPGSRPDADPAAALDRCLQRAELTGFTVGAEVAEPAGLAVAAE